jgi:hypothetical protein
MTQTQTAIETDTPRFHSAWRMVPPFHGESVRWETLDGRWIVLMPGHGASAGSVLVADSAGRCEASESFESAFELAQLWRAR